jgi:predicted MPP superfamily phosphohydrolase
MPPPAAAPNADRAADRAAPPMRPGVVVGTVAVLMGVQWGVLLLLAGPAWPPATRAAACVALVMLSAAPAGVLVRGLTGRFYPRAAVRRWVLRPFWYLLLALPLVTAGATLGALAGWPFGAAQAGARATAGGVGALLVVVGVAGYAGARRLVVRRLTFAFPDLPAAFDGLTVAHLSDLHVGPHTPPRVLARVRRAVEEAAPDLVVYTGDQVDDYARDTEPFAAAFEGLGGPLGAVAVAGNHDVYAGWADVRRGLEAMGLTVLVNEAVPLTRDGATLWLAGTGDPAGDLWHAGGGADAAPDVDATLARVPDGAFVLALAHNPALWPALARRGASLTLSGHTHYGQVALPRLGWCLASPFLTHAMGTHRDGAARLFIHPGTGYWSLPLRLGAWPEVALVTLRRDAPAAAVSAPVAAPMAAP